MAISYRINILSSSTYNDAITGQPAGYSVDILITDGSPTYYQIKTTVPLGQSLQTYLDASAAQLWALAVSGSGTPVTEAQAIIMIYIALHLNNRAAFASALYTLDSGIAMMAPVNLANYQSVLQATLNVLTPLPAAFLTHLTNERTAAGITMSVSSMTPAQCYTFDTLLHNWLNARHVQVLVASNQDWWLQITNGG